MQQQYYYQPQPYPPIPPHQIPHPIQPPIPMAQYPLYQNRGEFRRNRGICRDYRTPNGCKRGEMCQFEHI